MKEFLQKLKALFVKSETEKTTLQKTARASIIVGAFALIAVIVYFAAIAPLLTKREERIPDLFEGEYYQGGSIYMCPVAERNEIKRITIKNEIETYSLSAYLTPQAMVRFAIEGHEDVSISTEKESSLIGDVRVLITNSPAGQDRVLERATEEDLKNYGLDKASDPSYFEVELHNGTVYRVIVGKPLSTSRGYYAMMDGRKNVVTGEDGTVTEYDIVYSLEISGAAMQGSASLLSTQLTAPFGNGVSFAEEFYLTRLNGNDVRDVIVHIGRTPDGEEGISAASQVYQLKYPAAYIINEDSFSSGVLSVMASLTADSIVAYGEEIHTPDVYEKYGLDLDPDRLLAVTDQNYAQIIFECPVGNDANGERVKELLYFSRKFTDNDGLDYYYVYSLNYEIIGKLRAELFPAIEWQVSSFTSPYMYFEYFTSATRIELLSKRNGIDHVFTLSGKERSRHVDVTNGAGEVLYRTTASGNKIPLTYDVSYKKIGSSLQYEGEFEIFRNLHYVLITRKLAPDALVDKNTTEIDFSSPAHTVRVNTAPKDSPISFYQYGENGKRGPQVHDEGGNILCRNVKVTTVLADGTEKTLSYDRAFYDEAEGRFFLKTLDSNDGYDKPVNYTSDSKGNLKVTLYLPVTAEGEYTETFYTYEIYDVYDNYTDFDGKEAKTLNSTYMYLVPTVTKTTYRLNANGERTVLDETTVRATEGTYIRTGMIDKLFSDTQRLLDGKEIDTMGVN